MKGGTPAWPLHAFTHNARGHSVIDDTDPPPLPKEGELVEQLREKLGPYADGALLLHHLRICRGKVGWACNSYLRAVLAAPRTPGCEDFHAPAPPPPLRVPPATAPAACGDGAPAARQATSTHSQSPLPDGVQPASTPSSGEAAASASSSAAAAAAQPPPSHPVAGAAAAAAVAVADPVGSETRLTDLCGSVLERVLVLLEPSSVCQAAATCLCLARAARSEAVWASLFRQRWGDVSFPTDVSCNDASAPHDGNLDPHYCPRPRAASPPASSPSAGRWRERYLSQAGYARRMACPRCGAARASPPQVLPVIFGFPSQPLLAAMAARRLILGGDHLLDGCQVWTCAACLACWRWWPYARPARWLAEADVRPGATPSSERAAAIAAGVPAYTYEL